MTCKMFLKNILNWSAKCIVAECIRVSFEALWIIMCESVLPGGWHLHVHYEWNTFSSFEIACEIVFKMKTKQQRKSSGMCQSFNISIFFKTQLALHRKLRMKRYAVWEKRRKNRKNKEQYHCCVTSFMSVKLFYPFVALSFYCVPFVHTWQRTEMHTERERDKQRERDSITRS